MNFIYLDHLQIFRVFKPLLKQIIHKLVYVIILSSNDSYKKKIKPTTHKIDFKKCGSFTYIKIVTFVQILLL